MFGRDETKLGTLYFNLIHNSEMYGQIVASLSREQDGAALDRRSPRSPWR